MPASRPPAPIEPLCQMVDAEIASTRSPTVAVVRNVNWRVAAGEWWIVGSPPGAGKTALLQTAAGIQRPLAGEVRLFGRSLAGLGEENLLELRQRTGLVFEAGGRLFAHLTVGQNAALPYCYHQQCDWTAAAERLQAVLCWSGLEDYTHAWPAQLPRSLVPRAGLARALMMAPQLLLLDHPMRGLEEAECEWWRLKLAQWRSQPPLPAAGPVALVLAVEDLARWLVPEAHFALIHQGRWLHLGTAEEARHWLAAHDLLARKPDSG